ncbi:MAG: D-alanyl-D-alanine carboxypeptidase, partial [Alphaproteobacteria bacterium]|nr:D-alanyl-D-alanine carboxypeptidase [Alphaproteobacteria bacterium]
MKHILGGIVGSLLATSAYAYNLHMQTDAYFLYHPATKTVVAADKAQQAMYPASLTKLMTLYVLFENLRDNRVTLDEEFPVSEKAWRKGGSKMFVEVGKTVRVEDLIRGIIVSSGNDACLVVAEYLGGTEEGFAGMMNAKAQELGLKGSYFANATGWPDVTQVSTAEDMGLLAAALMRDFPQFYHYFSETVFTYSGIRQQNRNGLLRQNVGVDGLKTGHTEEAGYHLVASGKEEGERLISVVMGTDGFAAREGESLKLLRYGFTQFKTKTLWDAWQEVGEASVWLGAEAKVPLVAGDGKIAYLPRRQFTPRDIKLTYKTPLQAPIK